MKKFVIVFAILLMLSGGTIGIMKTLEVGPFAKTEGEAAEKTVLNEPPRFIEMGLLLIPIFTGDRVATTIQLQIKLETMGAERESKINKLMPRINDAFLSDLYAFIPRLVRKEGKIRAIVIKTRLEMIAGKVAGPDLITNVLVQSITDTSASK
jgi:flagellar basal body-associated protein FliL